MDAVERPSSLNLIGMAPLQPRRVPLPCRDGAGQKSLGRMDGEDMVKGAKVVTMGPWCLSLPR
jgi:hypothetical protein